ncbi:MAG TPA: sensor domain-containing protein [Mycobacterium sp.]|nr:sensor domain-containing protein [Mycobacterium sp.]
MSPEPAAKSTRVWLLAGAAVVVLAAVGLVAWLVIPGRSHSSSSTSSGPRITGEAVKQVLLGGTELTAMLGQPFTSTTGSPTYGGLDQMEEPATSSDCVGVMNVAPRHVYQYANVQSYARETWAGTAPGDAGPNQLTTKVMFVEESVVALPSAADAQALFAKFTERWKQCDGRALNHGPDVADVDNPPLLPGTEIHIGDVQITDTVLAASIALDRRPEAPDTRAVGVQGNCIIGVLIAFTGAENATGSADPKTSSIDMVQAMMAKAAKLS